MIEITIAVDCGAAYLVKAPPNTTVRVRDYDVPKDWEDYETDEDGDRYQEIVLTNAK